MRRAANIALGSALGAWAYAGVAWMLAYETEIPAAGGRALLLSALVVGLVLLVLAIACASQVFERVPPGDELRERAGFARILAWTGIIGLAGLGVLMLMPPTASP
jgi:hypothetical protein